ncbi:hypothetical protein N7478_005500 [Penicillium angulare]|uniref:uncharacterized protein n=1 Tax=Penicillium angulare TaxID=116970 RepID=UPI0025415A28|nr:uncharacterized protein N7478_005500 [Penicillium angulare]KAJ5280128.1 hypothetical protein N7478_005500 [Penicillium angulare]
MSFQQHQKSKDNGRADAIGIGFVSINVCKTDSSQGIMGQGQWTRTRDTRHGHGTNGTMKPKKDTKQNAASNRRQDSPYFPQYRPPTLVGSVS